MESSQPRLNAGGFVTSGPRGSRVFSCTTFPDHTEVRSSSSSLTDWESRLSPSKVLKVIFTFYFGKTLSVLLSSKRIEKN